VVGTNGKQNKPFVMKNLKYTLVLLLFPIIFSSCNQADQTIYGSVDKMLEVKKSKVDYISATELNELFEKQAPGLKVVDVREPFEFEEGHIPGSINVPRGVLEFSDQLTNRRNKVILYSGHQKRSSLSAINLHKLKFREVRVLEGGFAAWSASFPEMIEEGSANPVTSAAAKPTSSGGCGD
jgi:rhodanese-related sulfurtransferase